MHNCGSCGKCTQMKILGLQDLGKEELQNKKVLVRVDFNVPMEGDKITDDNRLRASLPSIKYLIEQGAIVILMSHFGRPKGEKNLKYSLKPVAEYLPKLINKTVVFVEDCIGNNTKTIINNLKAGDVCLLENLRFYKEEEANDDEFAQQLSELGDIYINDAFGAAHRAHASTAGIADYMETVAAGFLMEKEIQELGSLLKNPERPFLSIIGGSKVSSKLDILYSLIEKSDVVLVGGGMAYTFIKAQGGSIGNSLCEEDRLQDALKIIEIAKQKGTALIFPTDNKCVKSLDDKNESPVNYDSGSIPEGFCGADIGPKSMENFKQQISLAKTILWNGPVGIFEDSRFEEGSRVIAQTLVELHKKGCKTVIGGGDSAAAVSKFGYNENDFGHISTGGGASLEFLSGQILPGVKALFR